MRKLPVVLLSVCLLLCVASASAQTVSCPSGGFTMTLPDRFMDVPRTSLDDPDLVLHMTDDVVNLTVYVSYAGASTGFQVLTGNEIEYGTVNVGGMDMFYARGLDAQGNWITYSWMEAMDSVTIYFVWSGNDDAALPLISEVMNSVVFSR